VSASPKGSTSANGVGPAERRWPRRTTSIHPTAVTIALIAPVAGNAILDGDRAASDAEQLEEVDPDADELNQLVAQKDADDPQHAGQLRRGGDRDVEKREGSTGDEAS